jgi:hypothetical protein
MLACDGNLLSFNALVIRLLALVLSPATNNAIVAIDDSADDSSYTAVSSQRSNRSGDDHPDGSDPGQDPEQAFELPPPALNLWTESA